MSSGGARLPDSILISGLAKSIEKVSSVRASRLPDSILFVVLTRLIRKWAQKGASLLTDSILSVFLTTLIPTTDSGGSTSPSTLYSNHSAYSINGKEGAKEGQASNTQL